MSRFSQVIKANEIVIKTQFKDNFYVNSDNYSLEIIMSNLISNAIKYLSNESKIQIVLHSENNMLNCIIKDNGIGINELDLDKIYNSFYRSNTQEHHEIKGTGIGLSIVKRLCDLLKISISIQSKKDIGTTIQLIFKT